jgi:hypothetical protein
MARVYGISRKLAAYHVAQMEDSELLWRLEKYAGMELSAVGPNPRAGNPVSAQVPGPATMTAGRQRSTLLPRVMPDSEVEKPGQCRAAAKPPVRGKGF